MGERWKLPTGILAVVVGVLVMLGGSIQVPALVAEIAFSPGQFVDHWWVFPASVVFAMVAMTAGVSGALFFSPFFMLAVGLSPAQATERGS